MPGRRPGMCLPCRFIVVCTHMHANTVARQEPTCPSHAHHPQVLARASQGAHGPCPGAWAEDGGGGAGSIVARPRKTTPHRPRLACGSCCCYTSDQSYGARRGMSSLRLKGRAGAAESTEFPRGMAPHVSGPNSALPCPCRRRQAGGAGGGTAWVAVGGGTRAATGTTGRTPPAQMGGAQPSASAPGPLAPCAPVPAWGAGPRAHWQPSDPRPAAAHRPSAPPLPQTTTACSSSTPQVGRARERGHNSAENHPLRVGAGGGSTRPPQRWLRKGGWAAPPPSPRKRRASCRVRSDVQQADVHRGWGQPLVPAEQGHLRGAQCQHAQENRMHQGGQG
jgi:hypothetical protein